ncbi:MAG: hypothetical protein P8Y15_09435 [Gemmatimonadales bacterium]
MQSIEPSRFSASQRPSFGQMHAEPAPGPLETAIKLSETEAELSEIDVTMSTSDFGLSDSWARAGVVAVATIITVDKARRIRVTGLTPFD